MLANRIDGTATNEDVARGHEYAAFTGENAARMDERDTRVDRRLCREPRCHEPEHEKAEHPHGHLVLRSSWNFGEHSLNFERALFVASLFSVFQAVSMFKQLMASTARSRRGYSPSRTSSAPSVGRRCCAGSQGSSKQPPHR